MLEHISENLKKEIISALCKRYDNTNRKLQDDFVKMYYEDWQIESMRNELKRIDEIIEEMRK